MCDVLDMPSPFYQQQEPISTPTSSTSKVIIVTLLVLIVVFYMLYYATASLVFGSYKLVPFSCKVPFNFKDCCFYSSIQNAHLLSMVLTFFMFSIVLALTLRQRLWDYVVTVMLLHIFLSCLVMFDFPTNWEWWMSLVVMVVLSVIFGETYLFFVRRKKRVLEERSAVNCT